MIAKAIIVVHFIFLKQGFKFSFNEVCPIIPKEYLGDSKTREDDLLKTIATTLQSLVELPTTSTI